MFSPLFLSIVFSIGATVLLLDAHPEMLRSFKNKSFFKKVNYILIPLILFIIQFIDSQMNNTGFKGFFYSSVRRSNFKANHSSMMLAIGLILTISIPLYILEIRSEKVKKIPWLIQIMVFLFGTIIVVLSLYDIIRFYFYYPK